MQVVTSSGSPIEGASVSYLFPDDRVLTTDAKGKLNTTTEAKRVAISKSGYETAVLRRSELARNTRVVMRPHPLFSSPACNLNRRDPEWPSQLLYNGRPPKTTDVWQATTFLETGLMLNAKPAKDVKIVTADDRHSRYIGNGEDSVGYQIVDATTAQQLDRLIERACQTRVSGIVVDQHGQPLDNVIGTPFIGYERQMALIGANGTFEGKTTSPQIVFRRHGYRAVVVKPAANMRIVMYTANPPPFQTCPDGHKTKFSRTFQFPTGYYDRSLRDVDYSVEIYAVNTSSGKNFLRHGGGPTWSDGAPEAYRVSPSIRYEERTYAFGPFQITDANGTLADGTHWRLLGRFGETAEYKTKDPEAAKKFDTILDSACLLPAPPG